MYDISWVNIFPIGVLNPFAFSYEKNDNDDDCDDDDDITDKLR